MITPSSLLVSMTEGDMGNVTWLAKGIALVSLGKSITNYQVLDLPQPVVSADGITGEIVRVDRFGNLIANLMQIEAWQKPMLLRRYLALILHRNLRKTACPARFHGRNWDI